MIDHRGDTTMSDVGMHGVGKVDDGRLARQGKNFPFGREDIDFIREEVFLDMFEEFGRITRSL